MKKSLKNFMCIIGLIPLIAQAGSDVKLDKVSVNTRDVEVLQRGAKHFVNYCMACHSLKYMSYNRLGKDLALTKEQVFNDLMFSWDDKKQLSDYMTLAMTPDQAKVFFGSQPPDLSVITRARGVDWLYTYLRAFYRDPQRPFGMNNLVLPEVNMPHVFAELQGIQEARVDVQMEGPGATKPQSFETVTAARAFVSTLSKDIKVKTHIMGFKLAEPGRLSSAEYDQTVRELVSFLAHVSDPNKNERHRRGFWIIFYLLIFTVLAYLLKKEYWRDVH